MDLCQDASLNLNTTRGEECKKKQIRMWFSPRSRKVRCVLDKGPKSQQIPSNNELAALSAYDYVSTSPNEKGVRKKSAPKPKKTKKNKLDDINQEWGFEKQKRKQSGDIFMAGTGQKSSRAVSFCSPPEVLQSPDAVQETQSKCGPPDANDVVEDGSKFSLDEPGQDRSENGKTLTIHSTKVQNVASPSPGSENKTMVAKRKSQPSASFTTPVSKRLRKRKSNDGSCAEEISEAFSPLRASRRASILCERTAGAKRRDRRSESTGADPALPKSPCTPSFHNKERVRAGPNTTFLKTSPSNFPNAKRNHKGETMLHVAAIKGDLPGVEELLKGGAYPNVKDNAGWTPLHEACNHGHVKVVELLLQHQALVNTAGYQNDTPLHDAAKNGNALIVGLLLRHGASPDAVNIFGLRPVDYAETEEMKSALRKTQTNKEQLLCRPCPVQSSCPRRDGSVVLISSGLSSSQQNDLSKLAGVLRLEIRVEYNSTVTHVIVGDDPVLRTMKCMMGTLAGCWVLRFAWVNACLESCGLEPEEQYEIPSGPRRARLNREQLLPRLLDGCHFFFLGCFKEHRKEDLAELVKAAGGQILTRQPKPESDVTQTINTVAYHAEADSDQRFCTQYVIYDKGSKYRPVRLRQGKVWVAPSGWLIECIASFQLLPVHQ